MFYIRHVLPVIVLSLILGFLVSTFYVDKSVLFPETSLIEQSYGQQHKQQLNYPDKSVRVNTEVLDEISSTVNDGSDSVNENWSVDEFVKAIENKPIESNIIQEATGLKMAQDVSLPANHEPADAYLSSITDEAQKTLYVTSIDGETDKVMVHDTSTGKYKIITVKPGDSLSEIADSIYGDHTKYDKIFNANKNKISSPDDLTVGQKIKVPLQ
jgi:hypothetical protein